MDTTRTDDPKLPPDKGKEWMETNLPNTDDEDLFAGFSEQEQTPTQQENHQRKRRDNDTHLDKQTKQLKKSQPHTQLSTRSQTQKQIKNSTDNLTSNTTNAKSNNQHINNDRTIWIQNNQHDVLFIEPISIKEGEKLLEPMEVGKFLHDTGLDQFTELKRAGQYRYKLIYKKPKDAEKLLNATQLLKNNNYRAFIPRMLLETTGIIKNVPISLTEKEIYQNTISDKKKSQKSKGSKDEKTRKTKNQN